MILKEREGITASYQTYIWTYRWSSAVDNFPDQVKMNNNPVWSDATILLRHCKNASVNRVMSRSGCWDLSVSLRCLLIYLNTWETKVKVWEHLGVLVYSNERKYSLVPMSPVLAHRSVYALDRIVIIFSTLLSNELLSVCLMILRWNLMSLDKSIWARMCSKQSRCA